MSRQTLLSGFVLALVVSCDAGAAEPTLYAPGDLASILPTQVGDLSLEVEGSGGSEYLTEALGEEALTALTLCHRNAPCYRDRLHFAMAASSSDPDAPRLVVFAVRVEDVSAWDLGPSGGGLSYPADREYGRHLAGKIATPDEGWLLLYPYGEVLYGAIATSDEVTATSDDAIAAFPTCRQKDDDYVRIDCRPPELP